MEKMTHRQYVLMCQKDSFLEPEDYEDVSYPHPYIEIWMLCCRYRTPDGAPMLPDPEKGVLEQDADLMLGFDVLEEIRQEQEQAEAIRKQTQELARKMQQTR